MRIAKLNQRIEVLKPLLTSDGYGGYSTEYEKEIALWAEVKIIDMQKRRHLILLVP